MAVIRVPNASLFIALLMASFMAVTLAAGHSKSSSAFLITVDQSGKGDFKRIQDAINAVPHRNADPYYIKIMPGFYKEKITVPMDKPFITLSGVENSTIIEWDGAWVNWDDESFSVLASDVVVKHLTIQNRYVLTEDKATAEKGARRQGVAVRVNADRVSFYGCRILGHQDTLLADNGTHYFRNCYIEGMIDFICGNGASLFEKCHLHSLSTTGGAITAQKREAPTQQTGFLFERCNITGVENGKAFLGRPWADYSKVLFSHSYMTDVIQPEGWSEWDDKHNRKRTAFYGQHECYGPGANMEGRVKWSRNLSEADIVDFLMKSSFIGRQFRPHSTYFQKVPGLS